MIITKIEQQKKRLNRSSLYIDDVFYCGVDTQVVVSCSLKKGKEITQEELDEIERRELSHKAWDYVLRFVGIRMRSELEIRRRLKQKEYSEPLIDSLIKKSQEYNLINDDQFAQAYVRDRVLFRNKGKRALEFELKNKGIEKDIIQKTLSSIGEEDELGTARLALTKKYKGNNFSDKKAYEKAMRFLAGRGFSWPTIQKALDKKPDL
ncbi:MAG: regulatory protein RecX [Patescibacteria group bacterium]